MDSTLLYVTLAFALLSFLCSTYTTLRTLLPLLPGHPLNRRQVSAAVAPYGAAPSPAVEKRPRLKSAQRFTAYLASVDIFAACILVWEVAAATSAHEQLGASKTAASRIYLATTARPTLLLVVAVLSYANVVQGRQINLGRADWIVWLPALIIYAAGAGLASIPRPDGPNVWIGLITWLSAVTAIVAGCFGRLLIAILRVRRLTKREQAFSRFAAQQEKVFSEADQPYPALPTWHHNFSGISHSFIGRAGQFESSVDLPSSLHHVVPFTSDSRSAVSYAPSRASTERSDDIGGYREFRSPTPGSSRGLLNRSAASTPSGLSRSVALDASEAEILDLDAGDSNSNKQEDGTRLSISSLTSRASTYLSPGGFIGSSAVRNALNNSVRQAWGDSAPPGTGHSHSVELSSNEARGALIRIGGHLACNLLGYGLVSPFVFIRLLDPSSTAPLVTAVLLVLGVCQPGFVLAAQAWTSEGFWFRTPSVSVPTSSSARALEQVEVVPVDGCAETEPASRSQSRASSARTWKDSLPGIKPEGEDCAPVEKGRVGRALSMLSTHPRLQLLPNQPVVEPTSTVSGFVKAASTSGHARLRSLKLSRTSVTSMDFGRTRPRSGSAASRKTFNGFDAPLSHARHVSTPIQPFDTAIAMSLLKKGKADLRQPDKQQVPFGFGHLDAPSSSALLPSRSPSPSPIPSPPPAPTPSLFPASSLANDFAFTTHDFTLSPTASTFPSSRTALTSTAPTLVQADVTIDFLSAQLIPNLVPSIKVGKDVKVGPEDAPLRARRRSSVGSAPYNSWSSRSTGGGSGSKRSRNIRNLSLPLFSLTPESTPPVPALPATEENWVAVKSKQEQASDALDSKEPESVLAGLAELVRESAVETAREVEEDAPRDSQEWSVVDAVPLEEEKAEGPSHPPGRRASGATMLDISFEWEQEGATEVLDDEGALADREDADEEDEEAGDAALAAHQHARLAASLLSPLSPSFSGLPLSRQPSPRLPRPDSHDGSVVLRGSQAPVGSSDDDDVNSSTIHCASVHPVQRSDSESSAYGLRPTHVPVASINSLASFRSTASSSVITSQGFRNMLDTRHWARSDGENSGVSSDDQQPSSRRSTSASPVPPLVQPGHRPLSLLGQRDVNSSFSSYSSDGELSAREQAEQKERYRRATAERDARQEKRRSRSGMPLPPLPNVLDGIEEADEDAKSRFSGTPTPRSKRSRVAPSPPEQGPPPLRLPPTPGKTTGTTTRPLKTPPNVTSRSKARRKQGEESSNDENVRPLPVGAGTSKTPRSGPATSARSAVRGMR
ncbi:hypothetical protein JCM8547_001035 [Rhodosporidiobolus lusitaniae]